MGKKLFIGNIPWSANDASLQAFLSQYAPVQSVQIKTDRETGRSRGFAFADLAETADLAQCIHDLNNREFEGRKLFVSEAKPLEDRPKR